MENRKQYNLIEDVDLFREKTLGVNTIFQRYSTEIFPRLELFKSPTIAVGGPETTVGSLTILSLI